MVTKNENKVATRRNDLVEARYRLTLQEQRLMLWVISCIEPEDEIFKNYRISVKEISDVIGVKNKNIYSTIEGTTTKLLSRIIEIHSNEKKLQVALISSAEYNYGEGTVDIEVSPKLKKYLLQLKDNFTSVRLKYAFNLSSTYALRIYELLVQYRKISERKITVQELRNMLNISEEKYTRWDHFENRILKKSQSEINEKTDIKFTYQKIKKGKKISEIKFFFETQKEPTDIKLTTLEKVKNTPSIDRLLKHNIDEKTAKIWLKKYTSRIVEQAIDTLESALKRGTFIKNKGGWLRSALENGWKDAEAEQQKKEKEQRAELEAKEREKKQAEKLKFDRDSAYSTYRHECIKNLIQSLTEAEERTLRGELETYCLKDKTQVLKPTIKKRMQTVDVWLHTPYFHEIIPFLEQKAGLMLQKQEQFMAEYERQ